MELDELIAAAQAERAARKPKRINVCTAAGCVSCGADALLDNLKKAVGEAGVGDQVHIAPVGCLRFCSQAPLVQVHPEATYHGKVPADQASQLVASLKGGQAPGETISADHPFFRGQTPVVLDTSGIVEPERLESYLAHDGYLALYKVLHEYRPGEVIEEVTASGLRGRGGAGYPTGVKWATVARGTGPDKYVVCNADEGDPGAFMNRSVLESDPHKVLEGMAIAGYAVGAKQGYIYVRGEYPLAIKRLKIALQQAARRNLLGSQICGTPFDFRIDLRIGAGAFVCGEETALMASIMGERGVPRPRPPYPAEIGLWNAPTLINNVETFANVPAILRRGAAWFAGIGTEKSKGTKVFSLTGKVRHTGLVEVPLGTPLRTIVADIGGGAPDGGTIKAVQTGGPSGGSIPAAHLDVAVDYESLQALGSIMGSGGMIVMDQTSNMVEIARFFMDFCMDESCGKCIPCRAGTVQLRGLLDKMLARRATGRDLQTLEQLCDLVKNASLCGLGQTAPNPTLSSLRFFREEFESLLQPETPRLPRLPLATVDGAG